MDLATTWLLSLDNGLASLSVSLLRYVGFRMTRVDFCDAVLVRATGVLFPERFTRALTADVDGATGVLFAVLFAVCFTGALSFSILLSFDLCLNLAAAFCSSFSSFSLSELLFFSKQRWTFFFFGALLAFNSLTVLALQFFLS